MRRTIVSNQNCASLDFLREQVSEHHKSDKDGKDTINYIDNIRKDIQGPIIMLDLTENPPSNIAAVATVLLQFDPPHVDVRFKLTYNGSARAPA